MLQVKLRSLLAAAAFLLLCPFSLGFSSSRITARTRSALLASTTTTSTTTSSSSAVGPRIPIREDFPGLIRLYSNPDIFVIQDFLDAASCQDLINRAETKGLQQSPVAYAGWTTDFKDLVELAAKGPVTWLAIGIGWWQTTNDTANSSSQLDLIGHMVQNFMAILAVAFVGIGIFTKSRADQLQELRTSTSTTLDDLSFDKQQQSSTQGPLNFVRRTAELFSSTSSSQQEQDEASLFEAPTVIRYEAGQVLAPHYDANRSAATEDANRGGQTLATLLVYLNDVPEGGLTRFGKLVNNNNSNSDKYPQVDDAQQALAIRPKKGDALLFFPADANGKFDERTEHEGCPAVDEKYIARIWRHQNRVPPPFGLSEEELQRI